MSRRHIHIVQPYWVGTKDRKSLALIVPAQVAKEQNLNASTVFALGVNSTKIVLQVINPEPKDEETEAIPTGESLQASSQQVSSSGAQ
ncbi:MAG: hypothetical protein DLM72_19735 [Candidatus Nitrosopolaris wilkensis]|nr:MAG: hypothetical protein DLM72_19735 [Candidatus Nitrosopolaris wilkensis]